MSGQIHTPLCSLPNGTEEATVIQPHTNIIMPGGDVVSTVFELLPDRRVPVVFGQDFVFDYDIYARYANSLVEFEDVRSGDELMPMAFRRSRFKVKNRC
jgi:hypothetical protein